MHSERIIRVALHDPRGWYEEGLWVGLLPSGQTREAPSSSADRRGASSVSTLGEVPRLISIERGQVACELDVERKRRNRTRPIYNNASKQNPWQECVYFNFT